MSIRLVKVAHGQYPSSGTDSQAFSSLSEQRRSVTNKANGKSMRDVPANEGNLDFERLLTDEELGRTGVQ